MWMFKHEPHICWGVERGGAYKRYLMVNTHGACMHLIVMLSPRLTYEYPRTIATGQLNHPPVCNLETIYCTTCMYI